MILRKKIGFLTFIFLLSILGTKPAIGQNADTVNISKPIKPNLKIQTIPDSVFRFNTRHPSPKRAGLYSALVPSLGQIYNKQYWKTAVVYVGAATVSYFLIDNHTNFKRYQKAYVDRLNNPSDRSAFPERSLEDLKYIRDNYQQLKEYTVIAGVVCYLINILDAFTSAHLKTFDMSKNISYKLMPASDMNQMASIKLSIGFK